ncbi:cysteine hydrolase [uncultured Hyphomonas sp.]|jgi:nicotinamidase-related amidase|uniref:cysteine hydrolase family protein n=1 Tax=uncultured Hyphomonas sp. TaxID=225298 RepID=UPI000C69B4CC|nr:isochorismatase [Hyphomonadaceae bacterium]|tara:strand:- start:93085 stop:93762 length:678 start_codon:yes stop_codon:yes gene_type:complete
MTSSIAVEVLPHTSAGLLKDIIEPARTALLLIDVQVDFVSPEGVIGMAGVDMSSITSAIDKMETLRAAAKAQGATVAFLRVVTREETDSDALKNLYAWRGHPGQHAICRADEPGSDYFRLFPEEGDIDVEKVLFDGFFGTDLEEQLRARGIDTLIVAGVTTDCCVDQTARSAFHRNFNVVVVSDACAAYEELLHFGGLLALEKNCALLADTEAVLATWGDAPDRD